MNHFCRNWMEEISCENFPILSRCFCIGSVIEVAAWPVVMVSLQTPSLPLASSAAWVSMGNVPGLLHCHLKYGCHCTFLSPVVRMEQDEDSSHPQCHHVPMEGLLVCQIGWGLRERRWRYSGGPTVFSTLVSFSSFEKR